MVKSQKFDAERMALYPNLDYKQLYNALTQLMDVVPSIHIGLQGLITDPTLLLHALHASREFRDQLVSLSIYKLHFFPFQNSL